MVGVVFEVVLLVVGGEVVVVGGEVVVVGGVIQ